ncbi:peptide deformylase [Candidatus Uhrbacteria bacterium]|nr:peptide deformylase [Candidatus Uhrbacteria bacterium]
MPTVLTHPNPQLRIVSSLVVDTAFGLDDLKELEAKLRLAMKADEGIGIAAPQIGVSKRVILVSMPHVGPRAFVNPVIVRRSNTFVEFEEGCLSVPGVFGIVDRHKGVDVEAKTIDGHPVALSLKGLHAIVFQHEIDHLDGILFIDKVKRFTHGSVQKP